MVSKSRFLTMSETLELAGVDLSMERIEMYCDEECCGNNLRKYYRTADDEEPDCTRCDHQFSDTMCALCGPEHSWVWYKRSLMPEEWGNEEES